jgi:tetratricopeptide (TPR) repeat protein
MLHRTVPHEIVPDTFGALLRLLRRRARLTQADLGIAVGYSDAQICRLETGRRLPDLTALAALFLPALDLDPHGDEAQRLLGLAALACAESERPPPRPVLHLDLARHAGPTEDFAALLDACVALAEESERELGGGEQAAWAARMEGEHDRMRIALGWAQSKGDLRGMRLATALWRFWHLRGHLREGRRWMEIVLAMPYASQDAAAHARALDAAGLLAWRQSDYAQAEKWYAQALALARGLPGQAGAARVLMRLGIMLGEQRSHARAQAYYEESLALYRATADDVGAAAVLHNLGNLACMRSDNAPAMAYYEDCLALYERVGDSSGVALILLGIGTIFRDNGDLAQATATFTRSLELARALGDDWNMATALLNLADVSADRRSFVIARRHLNEAEQIFDRVGDQQSLSLIYSRRGVVDLLDDRLADAVAALRHGLMLASAITYLPGVIAGLEGLAACAGARQTSLAARLFAAAEAIRAEVNLPIIEAERVRHEAQIERARRRASPGTWERDWATGQALSPAEATALALANVTG